MRTTTNILRDKLNLIDLTNTMNGGIASTDVTIKQVKEGLHITMFTPGVSEEAYHIDIRNGLLNIYVLLNRSQNLLTGDEEQPVPTIMRQFPVPPIVNKSEIDAVFTDGKLHILLPFNSSDDSEQIDIRRS